MSETEQRREDSSDSRDNEQDSITDREQHHSESNSSQDTQQSTESETENSPPVSRSPSPPSQQKEEVSRPGAVENGTAQAGSDTDDYEGEYEEREAASEEGEGSLRLDLGYTEDEAPPDYDVTERVRQLNAELAADPVPEEDDRERSIKFKDNLVDLVAPPADYEEDEDDGVKSARDSQPGTESKTAGTTEDGQGDVSGDKRVESGERRTVRSGDGSGDGEEKVVVERSGQFDVVSSKDLTAEERILYGVDEPKQDAKSESCQEEDDDREKQTSHEPTPPSEPRPASASNSGGGRSQIHRSQRAQSAKESQQGSRGGEFNPSEFDYHSPYAQSEEDKKRLQKQKENRKKREQEQKEKEGQQEEEKNAENNDAFNAWLRKKRDDAAARRRQEDEERKMQKEGETNVSEEEEERDPEGAFDEWIKVKKQQEKSNKDENRLRQKEGEQAYYTRPRSQCDKAFKEWLKKKNQDLVRERNEAKQKARLHSLLARKSRKSVALARAIKQAQAFRYVDYYGYRY